MTERNDNFSPILAAKLQTGLAKIGLFSTVEQFYPLWASAELGTFGIFTFFQ